MPYSFAQNPEGVAYFIPAVVFQAIALVTVALRIWSRRAKKLRLEINDYAIFVALVLSLAAAGLLGASITVGLGVHITEIDIADIETFAIVQTALTSVWGFALLAIRVSIVHTYLRIFRVPWFIKTCYVWLAIETAWAIQDFLLLIFLCQPLVYQYNTTIPGGHCINIEAFYYATHVIIFTLDVVLTLLPTPVLWRLKMGTRKKITVTVMFGLGVLINIINLLRIAWRSKVGSPDRTYEYALLLLFTVIEIQLGIILACVPMMQPVAAKLSDLYNRCLRRSGAAGNTPSLAGSQFVGGLNKTPNSYDFETESVNPLRPGHDVEMDFGSGIRVTRGWKVDGV
ncbi:hypothetical protein F5X98DRAFT_293212 [Xylaria grammica]|nr:hypothetical protein F5X98DRAFT_293212 [Xylaria grammica]